MKLKEKLKITTELVFGFSFLFCADFLSALGFSEDWEMIIPVVLYLSALPLIYPLFKRVFMTTSKPIKRLGVYLGLSILYPFAVFGFHVYWQSQLSVQSFTQKAGHCAGVTGIFFGVNNPSDPQTFTKLWMESLSPIKQYLLAEGDNVCLGLRLEAAFQNRQPQICGLNFDLNGCKNFFLNQKILQQRTQLRSGLVYEILERFKNMQLLEGADAEMLLLQQLPLGTQIPQVLKIKPGDYQKRIEELFTLDTQAMQNDAWKKIIYEMILGKFSEHAEAYLVYWIDQKMAERARSFYVQNRVPAEGKQE